MQSGGMVQLLAAPAGQRRVAALSHWLRPHLSAGAGRDTEVS